MKGLALLIFFVGFIVLTVLLCMIASEDDDFDGGYGF